MTSLVDHEGRPIRLTNERLAHILEHPEMLGVQVEIATTLREPEAVIRSRTDPHVRLFYRYHRGTLVGDKYMCVVVKLAPSNAFVVTAYLTDKIKRGVPVWTGRT